MKKLMLLLAAAMLALKVQAGEATWLTDVNKAEAQAKTDKKLVLLDFTGSDWCSWCKKFKADVLDQSDFNDYAAKNLVLVELDFPHNKPQSAELKQANQALAQKYKVDGYPTFVILDAEGKELGRQVGYLRGGPKAFIEKLDKLRKP